MRWFGVMGVLLAASLTAGCDVARGAVFIATVSHYHGSEGRASSATYEPTAESADPALPPRVKR